MQFTSLAYLVFLPVVFALYWMLRRRLTAQNVLVVLASYLFYGWWDWRFLLLIGGYTTWSYLSGLALDRCQSPRGRKAILWSSVVAYLGVLAVYKYYDFFVNNFNLAMSAVGLPTDWPTLNLILPVGISFFTFQALGYTIDVYRRKVQACRDVPQFYAFVGFFPQLVAGPIERADTLLPQFARTRSFTYARGVDGMKQILWGLFKKMVIADGCGTAIDYIIRNMEQVGWVQLAIGAFFMSIQIYGDFSGYSDIAIGSGKLFGIRLSQNFRYPYFSRNVKEFWKRWHITLYKWLTDYVYIPLGGSRRGRWVMCLNIMIVFSLSGLWHGALWPFVIWGVYHGALLVGFTLISDAIGCRSERAERVEGPLWRSRLWHLACVLFTFFLAVNGWVVFRMQSMRNAAEYFSLMYSLSPKTYVAYPITVPLLIYIAVMFVMEYLNRNREYGLQFGHQGLLRYAPVRWAFYLLMTLATFMLAGSDQQFIYFQF